MRGDTGHIEKATQDTLHWLGNYQLIERGAAEAKRNAGISLRLLPGLTGTRRVISALVHVLSFGTEASIWIQ